MALRRSPLKVLGYIMRLNSLGQTITVRGICREFGWASPNTAKGHLDRLRSAGLVSWTRGTCGTIRPTCEFRPMEAT